MSIMLAVITLLAILMVENVDAEQAVNHKKTEPKEITIYISGEHKAVVAALLDAIDQETTKTGVADFDALSATYGLIGMSSKSEQSSDFYGYYFRLTLPLATDIASVAEAYENLSYIRFVETEPAVTPILKEGKKEGEGDTRIGKKLAAGVLGGLGGGLVGAALMVSADDDDFGNEIPALFGFWGGNLVGTAIGVSAVDPQDNFLITLAGSALLGAGVPPAVAFMFADVNNETASGIFGAISVLSAFLGPIVGATIASERWRKPLSAKHHLKLEARWVSVGLVPNPQRGLSAVTTLRF